MNGNLFDVVDTVLIEDMLCPIENKWFEKSVAWLVMRNFHEDEIKFNVTNSLLNMKRRYCFERNFIINGMTFKVEVVFLEDVNGELNGELSISSKILEGDRHRITNVVHKMNKFKSVPTKNIIMTEGFGMVGHGLKSNNVEQGVREMIDYLVEMVGIVERYEKL